MSMVMLHKFNLRSDGSLEMKILLIHIWRISVYSKPGFTRNPIVRIRGLNEKKIEKFGGRNKDM